MWILKVEHPTDGNIYQYEFSTLENAVNKVKALRPTAYKYEIYYVEPNS